MTFIGFILTITILLQIADFSIIFTRWWIYHVHGWIYEQTGKAMNSSYTWFLTKIFCSFMLYLAILTTIRYFA